MRGVRLRQDSHAPSKDHWFAGVQILEHQAAHDQIGRAGTLQAGQAVNVFERGEVAGVYHERTAGGVAHEQIILHLEAAQISVRDADGVLDDLAQDSLTAQGDHFGSERSALECSAHEDALSNYESRTIENLLREPAVEEANVILKYLAQVDGVNRVDRNPRAEIRQFFSDEHRHLRTSVYGENAAGDERLVSGHDFQT